jgi:phospholipid-translocating ATPase
MLSKIIDYIYFLGLLGREGTAAAQSADFAINKFCHLQRLLLVHGHWFYTRHSFLVCYSFYQNVTTFVCLFYFAFHSNFSGSTMYDTLFFMMFNSFYANFPVIAYGLVEQKYSRETLLEHPELYKNNRHNTSMSVSSFVKWFLLGLWHSICIYFPWYFIGDDFEMIPPQGETFHSNFVMIILAVFFISNYRYF